MAVPITQALTEAAELAAVKARQVRKLPQYLVLSAKGV